MCKQHSCTQVDVPLWGEMALPSNVFVWQVSIGGAQPGVVVGGNDIWVDVHNFCMLCKARLGTQVVHASRGMMRVYHMGGLLPWPLCIVCSASRALLTTKDPAICVLGPISSP